jgi:hypothetical protein
MNRQVYLAKGTFSHNLANLVVFALCFWWLPCLCKTLSDLPLQSCNYATFWSQILICHHGSLRLYPFIFLNYVLILSLNDFISCLFFLLRCACSNWKFGVYCSFHNRPILFLWLLLNRLL